MAVNRSILNKLFWIIVVFTSGCSSATSLPSTSAETEPPLLQWTSTTAFVSTQTPTSVPTIQPSATATFIPTVVIPTTVPNPSTIGLSTEGYPIEVYRYGSGPIPVLFIGGIHGGYEWNTILLAYEFIDYFEANSSTLDPQLSVYIIPSANPDGQVRVIGHEGRFLPEEVKGNTLDGRFNANRVDLNRNWDCDWSIDAVWRDMKLDPGKEPFSEVESSLMRDFILELRPAGVIFWHSAYPGVFAGECHSSHEPSQSLAQIYADASDYPAPAAFTSYPVTGDSTNWLALQGIASIEVELTNHEETDFDKNLKGVFATLDFLASQQLIPPELTPLPK